jgi:cysteine synthase B
MIAQLFHIEIGIGFTQKILLKNVRKQCVWRYQILTLRQRELLDHESMPKKVAEGGYDAISLQMKTTESITKTTGPEIWNDTEGTVTHLLQLWEPREP